LTGNALDDFMLRNEGKTWDGVLVPHAGVPDLDLVTFRDFRREAISSDRLTAGDLEIGDAELIDSLRLAEGNFLKRAAFLLFREDPERWFTGYDKYFKGMLSYRGIQRIETFPVAKAAIREAVINGIVHRQYSSGVPIQIKVFPERAHHVQRRPAAARLERRRPVGEARAQADPRLQGPAAGGERDLPVQHLS
jgi:ATP-dependent DNA helicase RecG